MFLQVDGQEGQDYQSSNTHEPPDHSNPDECWVPGKFANFSDLGSAGGPRGDTPDDAYQTAPDQKRYYQGRDDLKPQHISPVKSHKQGPHPHGCDGIAN